MPDENKEASHLHRVREARRKYINNTNWGKKYHERQKKKHQKITKRGNLDRKNIYEKQQQKKKYEEQQNKTKQKAILDTRRKKIQPKQNKRNRTRRTKQQ